MRQTGGKGQYGHAMITLEPLERGGGFEFESKIVGGSVPREYCKPIERASATRWPAAWSPATR